MLKSKQFNKQTFYVTQPLEKPKRIAIIDAVRGLAMLGIMMVNFPSMNTAAGQEASRYGGIRSAADELANSLSMALMNGKFYPIFAFLFGLSMFIFMDNAQQKAFNAQVLMTRRLVFLALFGGLHICLVWWGDILLCYAVLGLVLMLCFRLSASRLLTIGISFWSVLFLEGLLEVSAPSLGWNLQQPVAINLMQLQVDEQARAAIYANGSYLVICGLRIKDYVYDFFMPLVSNHATPALISSYLVYYARIFGLFALGMACGKSGLHRRLFEEIGLLKTIWLASGIFFLPVAALMICGQVPNEFVRGLSSVAGAFFYMCSMVLLADHPKTAKFLYFFVPVGRMSLTAYLLHTLSFSLYLYGYGFGFYGNIGPAGLIPLALGFYMLAFGFCHVWHKRWGMGPFERVWRWLTYGCSAKG